MVKARCSRLPAMTRQRPSACSPAWNCGHRASGLRHLQADQYYYADLVGMSLVVGADIVATVIGVCEGGGGDLLEVRRPDGTSAYIPFRKEFVGRVDIAAATIELTAPWILE